MYTKTLSFFFFHFFLLLFCIQLIIHCNSIFLFLSLCFALILAYTIILPLFSLSFLFSSISFVNFDRPPVGSKSFVSVQSSLLDAWINQSSFSRNQKDESFSFSSSFVFKTQIESDDQMCLVILWFAWFFTLFVKQFSA